jgi:hypothetical protein
MHIAIRLAEVGMRNEHQRVELNLVDLAKFEQEGRENVRRSRQTVTVGPLSKDAQRFV